MSASSKTTLETLYEATAKEFAARVREQLGEAIHSVVLYGSVARKTAQKDSDIDILVLSENGDALRRELVDISESLDFENRYATFLVATCFAPARLAELAGGGFPIAHRVLTEGVVLYDDGTFDRLRKNAPAAG